MRAPYSYAALQRVTRFKIASSIEIGHHLLGTMFERVYRDTVTTKENYMSGLEGKKVIIIGGSAGIGLGVAKQAVAAGALVHIVSRNLDKLQKAAQEIDGDVEFSTLDASDSSAVKEFFDGCGPFDHLVCTTHDSSPTTMKGVFVPIEETDDQHCHTFMGSKYWVQFNCAKYAAKKISREGSITLTSGVASKYFVKGHAMVAAVNAAVEAFASMFAREIGPVRVNVVSPGLVKTGTLDALPGEERVRLLQHFEENLPVKSVAEPADLAKAYMYLMQSPYHSGDAIVVDGGYSPGLHANAH